jgi:hypothetical protein
MTLAYHSFNDTRAASRFLAERRRARLLGGGPCWCGAPMKATFRSIPMHACSPRRSNKSTSPMTRYARAPARPCLQLAGSPVSNSSHLSSSRSAGRAVRSAATVGGNLFAPSPYGDFGVALLALDAVALIESPEALSELSLETFFQSRARLAAGFIVTGVRFARPSRGDFRFLKVSRVRPNGAAVLSIAAVVATEEEQVLAARVAFGAMAGTPVRAPNLERALKGAALKSREIERVVTAAYVSTVCRSPPRKFCERSCRKVPRRQHNGLDRPCDRLSCRLTLATELLCPTGI